jgi:hypothetical protein
LIDAHGPRQFGSALHAHGLRDLHGDGVLRLRQT